MKRIAKLFIGLACVSLGLTACKEDYFDPEAYQAIVKDAFPVSNISPDQDWAIFGTATAVVRVNGDYGEQYRVGIYQENPQTNQTVTQLSFITLNSGEQQTVQFSYLLAKPIVYFTVFDKLNRRVVKPVQASSTTPISVDFFGGNGSSARGKSPWTIPSYKKAFTTRAVATYDIYTNTNPYILGWGEGTSVDNDRITAYLSDGVKNAISNGVWNLGIDYTCEPYTNDPNERYYQLRIMGSWWTNLEGALVGRTHNEGLFAVDANSTNIEFELNNTDVTTLKNQGICLVGHGLRVSRIYVTGDSEAVVVPESDPDPIDPVTPSMVDNDNFTDTDYTGYIKPTETELTFNEWLNPSWRENKLVVDLNSSDFKTLDQNAINNNDVQNDNRDKKWWKVTGDFSNGINQTINGDQNTLNKNVIYVTGKLKLTSNPTGITYIVGDGGQIIIDQEVWFGQCARILVMEGGKLIIKNNSKIHFNGKNESVGFYNAGDVTFPSTVTMENAETGAVIYNASTGTMKIDELSGVRHLYNYGTLYVTKDFTIGQNDHTQFNYQLYNQGYMEVATATVATAVNYGELNGTKLDVSDNYYFNGGVSEFETIKVKQLTNFGKLTFEVNEDEKAERWTVNACYLHITDDQTANTGFRKLVMLKNSRLDMDGDMYFQEANGSYMEDKSLISVGGNFHVPNDGAQMDAPTASGEFAIIKIAGTINMAKWNAMTRPNEGTLYVDWANFNENFASYATIDNKEGMADDLAVAMMLLTMGSEIITETNTTANISIPAGECTGTGYNGTPTNQQQPMPQTTTFTYRYCFEDNFPQPGDYDFNDCVMTVTPKVTGREVELTVSLEAVGASKLLAGALRVKGVTESEIRSATVAIKSGKDLDTDLTSNILTYIGNYKNSNGNTVTAIDKLGENDDMTILTSDGKTSQAQNDLVIRLFNDAHWTMAGEGKTAQERLIRHFYNTMTSAISPTYPYLGVTPARTITYTITFPDTDAGKAAAAKFGVTSNLDPFIVERHNSIFWEVHTYPFKWDQVLSAYENNTKLNSYRYADGHSGVESDIANYPWAICVPGSFQYPLEYNSICGTRTVTGNTMGTTSETYRYFSSWAENKNNHQDWYEYPTSGMVWTGQ